MKLNLYMKSGNVIVLNGIDNYKLKANNDNIIYLELVMSDKARGEKLIMPSLDLSQIEAITQEDE